MLDVYVVAGAGAAAAGALFLASAAIASFRKCGPNQAMIVSGLGAQTVDGSGNYTSCFKIVTGSGCVVWPVIQEVRYLSLELMEITVNSETPFVSSDGIPIVVNGIAQVKVKGDVASISLAAESLLSKTPIEIQNIAQNALVGHLRALIGRRTVEELLLSWDKSAVAIQEESTADLKKIGLTVVSFTIKEIKDNFGYIEALGRQKTALAKKQIDISAATATRDTKIAQAAAVRDSGIAQALAQAAGERESNSPKDPQQATSERDTDEVPDFLSVKPKQL